MCACASSAQRPPRSYHPVQVAPPSGGHPVWFPAAHIPLLSPTHARYKHVQLCGASAAAVKKQTPALIVLTFFFFFFFHSLPSQERIGAQKRLPGRLDPSPLVHFSFPPLSTPSSPQSTSTWASSVYHSSVPQGLPAAFKDLSLHLSIPNGLSSLVTEHRVARTKVGIGRTQELHYD